MNSTQYIVWIHKQLEPDETISSGRTRKHTPTWAEKNKGLDKLREQLGDEKYMQMVTEEQEREKKNYYY